MTLPPQTEKVRKRLGRLAEQVYRHPAILLPGHEWAYVFGQTKKGRVLFLGPLWPDDAEKDLACLEDGEILYYKTRNLAKATQELKATLIERGIDPDVALAKMSHKRDW